MDFNQVQEKVIWPRLDHYKKIWMSEVDYAKVVSCRRQLQAEIIHQSGVLSKEAITYFADQCDQIHQWWSRPAGTPTTFEEVKVRVVWSIGMKFCEFLATKPGDAEMANMKHELMKEILAQSGEQAQNAAIYFEELCAKLREKFGRSNG